MNVSGSVLRGWPLPYIHLGVSVGFAKTSNKTLQIGIPATMTGFAADTLKLLQHGIVKKAYLGG